MKKLKLGQLLSVDLGVAEHAKQVLAVTATGKDLDEARQCAYAGIAQIRIKGSQHRTDIALKAARGEITV